MATPSARRAVAGFAAGRLVLMAAVLLVAGWAGLGQERHPLAQGTWWLDRFAFWDSYHFVRIAEQGYLPPGLPCCDQAFFPGYPLLMVAVRPLVGGSAIAAGLLVSVLASLAAAALLWALARQEGGSAALAGRAVLLLAVAPCAVFLGAVYTEAVFLALTLGAWLAASRHRWWFAGLLAAGACAVRVNGVFLVVALAVLYAQQLRTPEGWRRPRTDLLAMSLPAVSVGGYLAYLHHLTGSWDAWREAEDQGWRRSTAWPWEGLAAAVRSVAAAPDWALAFSRSLDVAAVVLTTFAVLALARQRRWAETAYLALSVGVVACSTVWVSAPRYALAWFPVYLLLARWGERSPGRFWVRTYAVVSAVAMALATVSFATRTWVA
ncbi:mannosyltransferase family protein [Pedococcus sp. 5OH_020]|uniref:mannosyltransferase family protein n=1 Tax=Pedococcus sp. 5OH_020 TaxID=2989814 RepID=UPI0022E9EAE2|nr:mannosyltransferase family protein [Pedococcus sp. 5OH_020]